MYLLFDIGGTNMRLALSEDGQSFSEPKKILTPEKFEDGISGLKKFASDFSGGEKIKAAAGGIAGPLDKNKTKLVNSPNLPGWIEKPLKQELEEALNAPVYLENDAALAGLGEAASGAGRNFSIVAYITVGTGVGGARIVEGRIDRNALGFEIGHQIIDFKNSLTLEDLISGTALGKKYGKTAEEIEDSKIWEEVSRTLAFGLNNIAVFWSPDAIVLGGSVAGNPAVSLEYLKSQLQKNLKIFPALPEIRKAELGDESGLYGALCYLKQQL